MDVKYKENEWDKSHNALKGLINSGIFSGKGVTDYLKDINRNFEDAQNDIRKDDPDGVISFSFTDRESKYQTMFEKMETLQDYAGDAGSMVERVIDEPFYKDIDKFVEKMEALTIENYETKNTIGATTIVTTSYGYGYGATPQTTTVPKDKINLSDIMAGDNFFADNLKAQFAEYSKQNPDQEFTYEQYQSAVSSSRAFEYESIRDEQQSREFWRDIGIAVVIIGVSILCPPAGLALGVAYGTLELTSAATGKDWMTGREMDGTERATRGAFALLDIIPGVKGIRAFSTATKAGGLALDAAQAGSKLTLRQTAKQGLSHVDAMGRQALRESAERIRKIPSVISDVASSTANAAKNQIRNGAIKTGKLADEVTTAAKNLDFGRVRVVADPIGGTHMMFDAAENTHRFENAAKGILGGSDEVAEGLAKKANVKPSSTYQERLSQTPVNNGEWLGKRGESTFVSEHKEVTDILEPKGLDGIEYSDAIPDFSPVSVGEVTIPNMSTERRINFREADDLLAEKLGVTRKDIVKMRKEQKLTWHELNDMQTMQLVPTVINGKFGHLGGVAEIKKLLGL